jgi:flagellar transcriptional activator FlhC
MAQGIDREIRALQLARSCAAFGARVRTISHVSGLLPRTVLRLLFPDRNAIPRGRCPDSREWYHGANTLLRAEASIVVTLYRRLRSGGFCGGDALIGAYRHYLGVCHPPARISFDRAFDLAAHTDGIWIARSPSFALLVCSQCRCEFLAPIGAVSGEHERCPFCGLLRRYATDPRVQASFPTAPMSVPNWSDAGMLAMLGNLPDADPGSGPAAAPSGLDHIGTA